VAIASKQRLSGANFVRGITGLLQRRQQGGTALCEVTADTHTTRTKIDLHGTDARQGLDGIGHFPDA